MRKTSGHWMGPYLKQRGVPRSAGDPADIQRAEELIRKATNPVLVAGGGAFWAHAEDSLKMFAESTGIPVFTKNAARGLLPDNHPQCYGGSAGMGVFKSDLVIIAGSRLNSNFYYGKFSDNTRIIQIDCNSAAMADNHEIELGICGDVALVLDQLNQSLDGYQCPKEWIERDYKAVFGENRVVAASLGDRPYDEMVEGMGGYGEQVEYPNEIGPALQRAFDSGKPACINVMIATQGDLR